MTAPVTGNICGANCFPLKFNICTFCAIYCLGGHWAVYFPKCTYSASIILLGVWLNVSPINCWKLSDVFIRVVLGSPLMTLLSSFKWFHWAFDKSMWKSVQRQTRVVSPFHPHDSITHCSHQANNFVFRLAYISFMSTSAFVWPPSFLPFTLWHNVWMLWATWTRDWFFSASKGWPPHPKPFHLNTEHKDKNSGLFSVLITCICGMSDGMVGMCAIRLSLAVRAVELTVIRSMLL